MAPQGRKIAVIGASGQVGRPLVDTLLAQGVHTITAIQRTSAKSTFPTGVVVKSGDLQDPEFLDAVLTGQDALVMMPPMNLLDVQDPAICSAARVGVFYVVPSEFGSDPVAKELTNANWLLTEKKKYRDLVEELGVSHWIAPATGLWLDNCLRRGWWGIDVPARKATLWTGFDGVPGSGTGRASTATIRHAGEATAVILSLPDAELARFKNKSVYVPSFHLTQREILDAAQRATGTTDADWTITKADVADMERAYETGIKAGELESLYTKFMVTHSTPGFGGDFEHRVDDDLITKLEQYGLKKETLEEAITAGLQ
ncbi:hypothetical protein SBRCBS47491_004669 [Sporothrix bragantina]|uniref:NmrA-like domain-containing protein n=1 Tax=Sporothrix bragantina TaxID=671064 RepID=A0ABP0BQY8_9PEZI